jgi:hypothetical protein
MDSSAVPGLLIFPDYPGEKGAVHGSGRGIPKSGREKIENKA